MADARGGGPLPEAAQTSWMMGLRDSFRASANPTSVTLAGGLRIFGLVLFGVGILLTVGAALNAFFVPLVLVCLVVATGVVWLVKAGFERRLWFAGDKFDLYAVGIAIVLCILRMALHHEYVLGQTDMGFYTNDAHTIATTGGRELHGAFDDQLVGYREEGEAVRPSAMFGYPSLAAVFSLLGGYFSASIVNGPLGLVTSLALYSVGRRVAGPLGAIAAQVAYEGAFPTIWLSRWLITENASTAVFWFSAWLVLLLWERWSTADAVALGAALAFGALARPEGFLLIPVALGILGVRYRRRIRTLTASPKIRSRAGLAFAGLAVAVAVVVVSGSLPIGYLRGGFALASHVFEGRPLSDSADVPTAGPTPNWGDYAWRYEWDSVRAYDYEWFLLAGIIGFALGIVQRRPVLLVAALAAPYLLFVIMPPVTTFHPFFLRRLWIAFLPLVVLLGAGTLGGILAGRRGSFLHRLKRGGAWVRAAGGLVLTVLLLFMADVGAPFYLEREDDGTKESVPWIIANVPEGDCILADQDVAGHAVAARFVGGRMVVPLYQGFPSEIHAAITAGDASPKCHILRTQTVTLQFLESDAKGEERLLEKPIRFQSAPRISHRSYLANPPLEAGYVPFAEYLENVPPPGVETYEITLELVELANPVVLEKAVHFVTTDWERTNQGMLAVVDEAVLRMSLEAVSPFAKERLGFRLLLAHPETQASPDVRSGNVTLALAGVVASGDGIVVSQYSIPAPVTDPDLRLPRGTVLRATVIG